MTLVPSINNDTDNRRIRKLDVIEGGHNHGMDNIRISRSPASPLRYQHAWGTKRGDNLNYIVCNVLRQGRFSQGGVDHKQQFRAGNGHPVVLHEHCPPAMKFCVKRERWIFLDSLGLCASI
jgi:hypothetical protein